MTKLFTKKKGITSQKRGENPQNLPCKPASEYQYDACSAMLVGKDALRVLRVLADEDIQKILDLVLEHLDNLPMYGELHVDADKFHINFVKETDEIMDEYRVFFYTEMHPAKTGSMPVLLFSFLPLH